MRDRDTAFHDMAEIISRCPDGSWEYATPIEGLYFGKGSSPTSPIQVSQFPCLAMVVQGEKCVELGQDIYRYGVGDFLIASHNLPVVARVTMASGQKPYLGLGVAINSQRLKDVMGRMPPYRTSLPLDEMRAITVNKAGENLISATGRLLKLLETPEHIPVLAPLTEQEILYCLLQGPAGARLRQIAMTETPSNRIANAISWLDHNFCHPLRIEALAEHVSMSVSSLHHHFKAVTAMTPVQYQKQLRLREARRLMVVERLDVGSAGFSVGYQSPSQFSREYSRLYGIPPSRDLMAAPLPAKPLRSSPLGRVGH